MKKIILILIALPALLVAQTADREVFAASGEQSNTASIQASWTMGEVFVATGQSASLVITEGFNQSSDINIGIAENAFQGNMTAYPNPTGGSFNLQINTDKPVMARVEILDVLGKVLIAKRMNVSSGSNTETFDLSSYDSGYYFCVVKDNQGNVLKTLKIQKL